MASVSQPTFEGEYLKWPLPYEYAYLSSQLEVCNNDAAYRKLVDDALEIYVKVDKSTQDAKYVRNILMSIVSRVTSHKKTQGYVLEQFCKPRIEDKSLFEYIIAQVTNETQTNINVSNSINIDQCLFILDFASAYTQCLKNEPDVHSHFVLMLPFFTCVLEVITSQISNENFRRNDIQGKRLLEYDDIYSALSNSIGQLSLKLSHVESNEDIAPYAAKMVAITHEILLNYSQLNFLTISMTAVVQSYFAVLLPVEEKIHLKHKNNPLLDFLDNPENDNCMVLKNKRLSNVYDNDVTKFLLCMSLAATVEIDELISIQYEGDSLLVYLFHTVCDTGMKMAAFPEIIKVITTGMLRLSERIVRLNNYSQLCLKTLRFVWEYLDYSVELVVDDTKMLLIEMLKRAAKDYDAENANILETFFSELNRKSKFSKVYLNALYCAVSVLHGDLILTKCGAVHNHLLTVITTTPDYNIAYFIYTKFMDVYLVEATDDKIILMWLLPVLTRLRKPKINKVGALETIITRAIAARPRLFRKVFPDDTMGTLRECNILLQCVRHARIEGIEFPLDDGVVEENYWRGYIRKDKFESFMVHQDDTLRLASVEVIAECHKKSETFTSWELDYLRRFFVLNVGSQSAAVRSKFCNFYKKIFVRHNATLSATIKKTTELRSKLYQPGPIAEQLAQHKGIKPEYEKYRNVWMYYQEFYEYLVRLMISHLSPASNHARRAVCLELLICAQSLTQHETWRSFFQEDEVKWLKHILNDNYESNKVMALKLLSTLPSEQIGLKDVQTTTEFYEMAVQMACDVRPSQNVSASYMFHLLLEVEHDFREFDVTHLHIASHRRPLLLLSLVERLEQIYARGHENLVQASKTTPFYGLLLCCRSLIHTRNLKVENTAFSFIFHQLANLCLNLKNRIMPVVCHTSPEGSLPSESSEESDDVILESVQSTDSQKILVYSWKTMKEIMLLLSEMISQNCAVESSVELLSEVYLIRISDFFLQVFINAKHRGVFEQAHVAFTKVAKAFIYSTSPRLNRIPKAFLNTVLNCCRGTHVPEGLFVTRRSAGLPFLLLSVLPTLTDFFPDWIRRTLAVLFTYGNGEREDLQIHSLNVLRFLFKSSKLNEKMRRHVDRATVVALRGFESRSFAVRNSATLLLAALVTKIFGVPNKVEDSRVHGPRVTTGTFAMNYPQLFEFLLETVKRECESRHSLILHPVLLILSRLYPSNDYNVREQLQTSMQYINRCVRNPAFATRDLAARASVALTFERDLPELLTANFRRLSHKYIPDTECHGLLLQISHIFNTAIIETVPLVQYLDQTKHIIVEAGYHYSHLTVSLYNDVAFTLLARYKDLNSLPVLKEMVALLDQAHSIVGPVITDLTSYKFSHFQLITCILVSKFDHCTYTYMYLDNMIQAALHSEDFEMKKKMFQFLICLHQDISTDVFREHPLFLSGELEICPRIKALVKTFDFKSKKQILIYTHANIATYINTEINTGSPDDKPYIVYCYLLMRFYPCFFRRILTSNQQIVFDWILLVARLRNEEVTAALISTLKTYLLSLTKPQLEGLDFSNLFWLLRDSSAPTASDFRRLATAQFMVDIQPLFKKKIFKTHDRCNFFNVVMILLEDDEVLVRNTMSLFPTKRLAVVDKHAWPLIPHRVRSSLSLSSSMHFATEVAINVLVSWAIRRLPEVTRDYSEDCERSELNPHAENIPVTYTMGRTLNKLLWESRDHGECLEEKAHQVTMVVLNCLAKAPSPMVDNKTKRNVICVLGTIAKFIANTKVGESKLFKEEFRTFFNDKPMQLLRNTFSSLDTDYSSVKAFLTYLYNPLLDVHSKFPD